MTILRVTFGKNHKHWRRGETYLVDEHEAKDALDARALHPIGFELPEQDPAVTVEDEERISDMFSDALSAELSAEAEAGNVRLLVMPPDEEAADKLRAGEPLEPPRAPAAPLEPTEEERAADLLRSGRGDALPKPPPPPPEPELSDAELLRAGKALVKGRDA